MARDGRIGRGSERSLPLLFVVSSAVLVALVAVGCQKSSQPFDPTLASRDHYLCCNLHFNHDYDATNANYIDMKGGTTVPFGTRVKLEVVGRDAVRFRAVGDPYGYTYTLELRFGAGNTTATKYFSEIFLDTDPTPQLEALPPSTQGSIRKGEIAIGMTKNEVLMSRGYPPLHQTVNLEFNDWLYYRNGEETDLVHFEQGRVQSVTAGKAP